MEETRLQLSPSSATSFKSCPQMFKFRQIDCLPEPVSRPQARGSLVHAVLERLMGEAPASRTPQHAYSLLDALWAECGEDPEWRPEDLDAHNEQEWLQESRRLLANYFKLEDPGTLDVARLEWWVEYELADVHLRGVIDRVEERSDGSWVLTDYKTGRVPLESRELAASFGLRFYALMCWRSFGVIPEELRLVYLTDPAILTWRPTERTLIAFERQMQALARAVRRAADSDDWRARPSPLCMSCPFQGQCPAWTEAEAEA